MLKATGITKPALSQHLNELMEEDPKLVTQDNDGKYILTENGRQLLEFEDAKHEAADGVPQDQNLYEPTQVDLVLAYASLHPTETRAQMIDIALGGVTLGIYSVWLGLRTKGRKPTQAERDLASWLRRLYVDSVDRKSDILEDLSDELKLKSVWTLARSFSGKEGSLPFNYTKAFGSPKVRELMNKVVKNSTESESASEWIGKWTEEFNSFIDRHHLRGHLLTDRLETFLEIWGWYVSKRKALGRRDFDAEVVSQKGQTVSGKLLEIALGEVGIKRASAS